MKNLKNSKPQVDIKNEANDPPKRFASLRLVSYEQGWPNSHLVFFYPLDKIFMYS